MKGDVCSTYMLEKGIRGAGGTGFWKLASLEQAMNSLPCSE